MTLRPILREYFNPSAFSTDNFNIPGPGILLENFKDRWRLWSYEARGFLSQYNPTMNENMETIETMATPLTDEYLASIRIDDQTHAALKRLLVHKLDGEPAEVVRSVSKKHSLEQYRILA